MTGTIINVNSCRHKETPELLRPGSGQGEPLAEGAPRRMGGRDSPLACLFCPPPPPHSPAAVQPLYWPSLQACSTSKALLP